MLYLYQVIASFWVAKIRSMIHIDSVFIPHFSAFLHYLKFGRQTPFCICMSCKTWFKNYNGRKSQSPVPGTCHKYFSRSIFQSSYQYATTREQPQTAHHIITGPQPMFVTWEMKNCATNLLPRHQCRTTIKNNNFNKVTNPESLALMFQVLNHCYALQNISL